MSSSMLHTHTSLLTCLPRLCRLLHKGGVSSLLVCVGDLLRLNDNRTLGVLYSAQSTKHFTSFSALGYHIPILQKRTPRFREVKGFGLGKPEKDNNHQSLQSSVSKTFVKGTLKGVLHHLGVRTNGKVKSPVLALAAHILKLEQYREDQHGPCARMTCKFMKRSIFLRPKGKARHYKTLRGKHRQNTL